MKRYGKSIIAVLIVLGFAILMVVQIITAQASPLDTYHSSWVQIKDSAAEDAATFAASLALDANEGVYASKPSDAYPIPSIALRSPSETISQGGAWIFVFYGTDAANETFSFTMIGWAKDNGMAEVICEGDGVLGSQDVVTEPNGDSITNGFWADTINIDDTTLWPSIAVYDSGNNHVAKLIIDMTGIEYVTFYTYDVAGGSEASTIGVYGRPY